LIQIEDNYIIINISVHKKSFKQLWYNDISLYENKDQNNLALLEYYIDNDRIILLNQNIDLSMFKITYGQKADGTTKFYVKFSYPESFISRERNPSLQHEEKRIKNKFFLKWEFGKYIDDNLNIFSEEIFKIPSKKFFCFWSYLDDINESVSGEKFLDYYISYDNKSIAFIIANETSSNDISGFHYIGALENAPNTVTNEEDNFGSCGTALLNQHQPWDVRGYYEIFSSDFTSRELIHSGLVWNVLPYSINNFTEPDFIFYRTPAGGFYQEHKVGQYSQWELNDVQMKRTSFTSAYTGLNMLSKVQLAHPYEQARGYLRRVLSAPSNGKYNVPITVACDKEDQDFIYLRKNNTKDMFKNSHTILNTVLLQTTN